MRTCLILDPDGSWIQGSVFLPRLCNQSLHWPESVSVHSGDRQSLPIHWFPLSGWVWAVNVNALHFMLIALLTIIISRTFRVLHTQNSSPILALSRLNKLESLSTMGEGDHFEVLGLLLIRRLLPHVWVGTCEMFRYKHIMAIQDRHNSEYTICTI